MDILGDAKVMILLWKELYLLVYSRFRPECLCEYDLLNLKLDLMKSGLDYDSRDLNVLLWV